MIFIYYLIQMNIKINRRLDFQAKDSTVTKKEIESSNWKTKNLLQEQRKLLKKRLFGEHYNYKRVDLNKEKKYLLQEQKNTEIQRNNVILLRKIQNISKRSAMINPIRRVATQQGESFDESTQIVRANYTPINRIRYENKSIESEDVIIKPFSSEHRSSRLSKKPAFKGFVDVAGKTFDIKAYFEQDKYVIAIFINDLVQKIKMERENYLDIYADVLQKKHSNIVNLLKFNGKLFQLQKIPSNSMEVEVQKELKLPIIESKVVTNKRKIDANDAF